MRAKMCSLFLNKMDVFYVIYVSMQRNQIQLKNYPNSLDLEYSLYHNIRQCEGFFNQMVLKDYYEKIDKSQRRRATFNSLLLHKIT